MRLLSYCVAVAAVACGGDNVSGPAPCDTYTGGILSGNSGGLPGTYTLKAFCSGTKPDKAGGIGDAITITEVATDTGDFTASVTDQGTTTTYSGTYATALPDGITVHLTSPFTTDLVGTYRLRNDSLAVSGTVFGERLSLVGTRAAP